MIHGTSGKPCLSVAAKANVKVLRVLRTGLLVATVANVLSGEFGDLGLQKKFDLPRINTSPSFSAYLRISEGCDNA